MAKFFINRPIVAMVISILMVLMGLVAMSRLPIAQFPNIADPQIQVNATYPGADALTVEQSVATPIEQQMSGVDNMEYMYSLNANNGSMKLTVDFNVKTDPNTDQILAQMRQGQANSQLPTAVINQGVTVQKSTAAPLIMFALYSPNNTYDSIFLANYCLHQHQRPDDAGAGHRQRLGLRRGPICPAHLGAARPAGADGHHGARNHQRHPGAEHRESRRQDRRRARAQGAGIHLCRALAGPSGKPPEEFGDIVLRAAPGGAIVRVKDVARIELGAQNYDMLAPAERQARRAHRPLPVARLQCRATPPTAPRSSWPS